METETPVVSKPTHMGEWTLFAALLALCVLGLLFAACLVLPAWPVAVDGSIINYLGIALVASVVGIMIMVIAFCSPLVGTIKMTGLGAQIDIDGNRSQGDKNVG